MNAQKTYSSDPLGYYAVLNLSPSADDKEIKLSYREQAKKWHPDHNSAPNAMEVFQKISVAYDVLSDEHKRLIYDLASLSHSVENFPDIFALKVLTNVAGQNDVSVRGLSLWKMRGRLLKYNLTQEFYVCSPSEAEKIVLKNSLFNNLLGWWSPQALLKNFSVLRENYRQTGRNDYENFCLLTHNALAYEQDHLYQQAFLSAGQAWEYAAPGAKVLLERFMKSIPDVRRQPLPKWNFSRLRRLQLIVPGILIGLILLGGISLGLKSTDFNISREPDKINYYQQVRHWRGQAGVDDVVVAKIMDIRSDSDSLNMLYHVKSGHTAKVMYGPSDDFDRITELKNEATVRVTGISPDKVWYRVTLDNGDMGFVHAEELEEGIGAPVPPNSQVYTGE